MDSSTVFKTQSNSIYEFNRIMSLTPLDQRKLAKRKKALKHYFFVCRKYKINKS